MNHDRRGHPFVFYSDCNPFGMNPEGSQLFSIDWSGGRLRQLTQTTGVQHNMDGSIDVEIPGPMARGGR